MAILYVVAHRYHNMAENFLQGLCLKVPYVTEFGDLYSVNDVM